MFFILALFFQEVIPASVCGPRVESVLALCDVLDHLCHVQEGMVTHIALKAKILEHLRKLKLACGNLFWVYKHHAAAKHLARQLELHGLLIALFTQERRHKLLKKYIQGRKKGRSWERGLMEEVTLQHLHDLKSQW